MGTSRYIKYLLYCTKMGKTLNEREKTFEKAYVVLKKYHICRKEIIMFYDEIRLGPYTPRQDSSRQMVKLYTVELFLFSSRKRVYIQI